MVHGSSRGDAVPVLHPRQRGRRPRRSGEPARRGPSCGRARSRPGARDGFIVFGLVDWDEFETPEDPECFGLFGGYFYNPLSIVRLMGARLPGASPEDIDRAYFDPNPEIPPYIAEPWHESERHAAKLGESLGWVMSTDALREVDEEKVLADRLREERPDLSTLHLGALLARARIAAALPAADVRDLDLGVARRVGRPRRAGRDHAPAWAIRRWPSASSAASRWTRPSRPSRCGSSPGWSARSDELTGELAAGRRRPARPARRADRPTGARVPGRLRALRPRLRLARPQRVGPAGAHLGDPPRAGVGRHRAHDARPTTPPPRRLGTTRRSPTASGLTAEVRERLAADAEALATFEAAMRSSAVFLAARERYKTNCIKVIGEIRACFLELGRRMVERGALDRPDQVFFLVEGELDHFRHEPERVHRDAAAAGAGLHGALRPRAALHGHQRRPPLDAWTRRGASTVQAPVGGDGAVGTAGSGGVARGRGPRSSSTRRIPSPSSPATSSSPPTPIRPGRRCSCRPAAWWPRSARWAATP